MNEEPAIISSGWSITAGELKAALAAIPDDYEVMLENADVDDIDISNVNINRLYPPSATGSPGLIILGGGQIVNSEYDYDNRMDAHHAVGGDKHWSRTEGAWVEIGDIEGPPEADRCRCGGDPEHPRSERCGA